MPATRRVQLIEGNAEHFIEVDRNKPRRRVLVRLSENQVELFAAAGEGLRLGDFVEQLFEREASRLQERRWSSRPFSRWHSMLCERNTKRCRASRKISV